MGMDRAVIKANEEEINRIVGKSESQEVRKKERAFVKVNLSDFRTFGLPDFLFIVNKTSLANPFLRYLQ
jgi:hypothetical protein